MKNKLVQKISEPKFLLAGIVLLAAALRVVFFMGHVFSDDSHYTQLAISFIEGNYPAENLIYAIQHVRKLVTLLTAFGFLVFGKNEVGSVALPFIISLLSIPLIYSIAKELLDEKVALTSAFILAIFPTDIIFSTLLFTDLIAAFFINMGIYNLVKYLKYGEVKNSFFAGIYFAVSMFAKINFYFIGILIVILIIYSYVKTRKPDKGLLISLIIPAVFLIVESVIYGVLKGDYFYRLYMIEKNYESSYYNFFPYTVFGKDVSGLDYVRGVLHLIFIDNIKNIFLRRYYLLIPVIALIQSLLLIKLKDKKGIVFWFLGLVVVMAAFTSSPFVYRPLDLTFSWFIYPIFFPAIILASSFLHRFSFKLRFVFFIFLIPVSIVMTKEYHVFFDVARKNEFKNWLRNNKNEVIYTDHHTKYGIDLIDRYPQKRRTINITNTDIAVNDIPKNSLVIFNPDIVGEIKKEGHNVKLYSDLSANKFVRVDNVGGYEIFRKIE